MSLTIEQVKQDAKTLVLKLRETNSSADSLINESESVKQQIEIMKQYSDEIGQLNETAGHRPHSQLVAGINLETRQFRELQQENQELKAALEEQQKALELIMTKYRQQVTRLVDDAKIDLPKIYHSNNTYTIDKQAQKISEMLQVIRRAASADDEPLMTGQEELMRLYTENKGLREMLKIASENEQNHNLKT